MIQLLSLSQGAQWSHAFIEIEGLKVALSSLRSFPRMSQIGIGLAAQADCSIRIREALLGCSWSDAATWKALPELLESIALELREGDEVR